MIIVTVCNVEAIMSVKFLNLSISRQQYTGMTNIKRIHEETDLVTHIIKDLFMRYKQVKTLNTILFSEQQFKKLTSLKHQIIYLSGKR